MHAPLDTARLDATFAALADPTRRGVIDLLRRQPRRAGELADSLAATAPAMSRHLRVLRESGLVEEEHAGPDARVRVYRLRQEPFGALRGWLDEVEAFWTAELAAFKAHAERTRGAGAANPPPKAPPSSKASSSRGSPKATAKASANVSSKGWGPPRGGRRRRRSS